MGSTAVVIAIAPRRGRKASRRLVAVALLALCNPAFADDAPAPAAAAAAPSEKDLAEVVVTAEKRESTVQETPISISALSAAQLQNQNITTIEDLAGAVPGVSMRT